MIVDVEDRVREATQEDIVIFDRALIPAVLAHDSALEGIFPLDGVLARVEVKSTLTRSGLKSAVLAAKEIYEMKFSGGPGRRFPLPVNAVFAFGSDLIGAHSKELERLLAIVEECGLYHSSPCHEVPGPIHILCVVGKGCCAYQRLVRTSDGQVVGRWIQAMMADPYDEILHFVGLISNMCFTLHALRLGGRPDSERAAGGGIGNFILTQDTLEDSPVQQPPKGVV